MGSSYKRLALVGAAIAALIVSAAFFGATSSASAAKKSRLPSLTGRATSGSQSVRSHHLKAPKAPNVVLYDQYDNDSLNATSSQNFEADFDAFDDETADDFVVPGGETWNINQVDAAGQYFNGTGPMVSANVSFYADAGGLPGSQVATRPNMTVVDSGGSIVISIPSAVTLGSGHYWVSVQANMDFSVGGQWGFEDRLVQSNAEAAWQNPGGGFGVCPTWGGRNSTCGIDPGVPDQVFRLSGTTGGGGPSCSGGPITINDDGPATPYPSTCVVSGLSGEINDVNLTFTGLSHTYPDDIDVLLVSPDGDNATIMSDTGGSTDLVGCDLTLDDQAAQALPDFDPIVCPGSYQPADFEPGDPFPAPAPTPSGNVNLSTFNGGTANGTWSLYVVDDAGIDVGNIADWSLNVSAGGPPPPPPPPPPPGWQIRAPMPTDFYGGAMSSDASVAYIAGGYSFTSGLTMGELYKFDPAANTWSTLADMTPPAIMAMAVYYPTTNKLYVFGGEDAVSAVNYDTTRIYDVASNTWSTGAPMPDVRSFAMSGYNPGNGKIYVVSGYNTGFVDSAQPTTWEYDPVANTWATKAPIPHAVGGAGQAIINGHMYIAGGRDASNTVINLCQDYNIAADSWGACANLPAPNNVPGSGVSEGKFYEFGGGNPFLRQDRLRDALLSPDTTGVTVAYDPAANMWSSAPSLHIPRSFPGGTNVGDTLVAAGGYTGATTTNSTETPACSSPSAA